MIPRRIHYFWAGSEVPEDVLEVLSSWRRTNSRYELIRWDEWSIPQVRSVALLREAKRWSALSDFARAFAVHQHGGFYLDTDIELLRSLDPLRDYKAFVCVEAFPIYLNSAASGGEAGSQFFQLVLDAFQSIELEKLARDPESEVGPKMVTRVFLKKYGLAALTVDFVDEQKSYAGLTVLPKRSFFPYNWNESLSDSCIHPEETFGVHRWRKRW